MTDNKDVTSQLLKDKFSVFPATFKSINDELQYKIKLPDDHKINDFVSYLTSLGELTHFVEEIPSVSDIFIQTIQNN